MNFASRGISQQQLLLALILSGNSHGTSRTAIIDTLWPHSEGDMAEKSFRTSLYRLRQVIGIDTLQQSGAILSLNAQTVWIDSLEFETHAKNLIKAIMSGPEPLIIEQSLITLHSYAGDFLPDIVLPQVITRRDHLRHLFHELIKRLADHFLAHKATRRAIDLYHLGLRHSEPSETLFQGLLQCHLVLKQYTEGLVTYERCHTFLHARFNVKPSAETEELRRVLAAQSSTPPDSM